MKVLLEEYGLLIVSVIIGTTLMGIGMGIMEMISPFIDAYVNSIM